MKELFKEKGRRRGGVRRGASKVKKNNKSRVCNCNKCAIDPF